MLLFWVHFANFFISLIYIFSNYIFAAFLKKTVNSNCSLILQEINMYINVGNKEINFRIRMCIAFIFSIRTGCCHHCMLLASLWHRGLCIPRKNPEDISNSFFFCLWLLRKENTLQEILLFFLSCTGSWVFARDTHS
jgi:hypothetical protein